MNGEPQLFGLIFTGPETPRDATEPARPVLLVSVEDPESLDARRAAIGLPPVDDDLRELSTGPLIPWMDARTTPGNQWPAPRGSASPSTVGCRPRITRTPSRPARGS